LSNYNFSIENVNLFSGIGYDIPPPDLKWPLPMRPKAYYGLAGEFVSLTLPHTESDPVALIMQFLTMFGNAAGRNKYFQVEATRHYPRLFIVLTGATAKARKGTSLDHVESRIRVADSTWAKDRITSGLGSGEGLIWKVLDPNREDPGVSDKRLLVIEPEFASILKVITRKDSILSDCARNGWDDRPMRNTNKNSPATATGAHISIIGHITNDELKSRLDETEMANGFANRFLFVCGRRSKLLPEGGEITKVDFSDFDNRVLEALEFAKQPGEIVRDEVAREMWIAKYPTLSAEKPGLFGALTARAEAQVVRLSLIYALLDKSPLIRIEHLEAGLAVWEYAEASVRYIFGEATGNRDADTILESLRSTFKGLTKTQISKIFQGNYPSARIDKVIEFLKGYELIKEEKSTNTGGRHGTIYRAV
jgi:hypothetical protein